MSDRSAKPHRPYARRDRKANSPPQGESFGWLTLSMMKSAAYRALSPAARKVLDRIHVEHLEHAGKENGRLKVTYRDLKKAGVQQRRIPGAIDEVEALGWAIRTYRGRTVSGEDRGAPTQYRLTWVGVTEADNATPPTNEWKRFGDDLAEAKRAAKEASGRTMAQRDRDSFLTPTPGQNIEGASQRGVQKNRVRGVQKNAPTNTQRGCSHRTQRVQKKKFLRRLSLRCLNQSTRHRPRASSPSLKRAPKATSSR